MATQSAIEPHTSLDRPRVLVVDDEYGPREAIAFTLGTEFSVDTADRAATALEKIRHESYEVIILDIRMPEMDGIKALARIREIDQEVAVVMLTGYGTLATAQQAMLGGANQYLRKPPDIAELLEAVRKQAGGTLRRRQETMANTATKAMLVRLKEEMSETEPNIWQGKASVELVHDLANPLTVMIGYASLLGEEAEFIRSLDAHRGEKVLEYANIVERAAEYCHHLAENWRHSSRKAEEYVEVDLISLVEEVKEVIFFSNEALSIVSGSGTAMVKGSKLDLVRVFQNLIRNALEANSTRVSVGFEMIDRRCVVTILDNGEGMNYETSKRGLAGGFSTKPDGTGLGLRICSHLLGAHGATLNIESQLGESTLVRIEFPAVQ